jgi:hypothetical protein
MTSFSNMLRLHLEGGTPPAIACWLAAIQVAYSNFVGRPCFLAEQHERWFDPRMLNPTTGPFVGIREDWTW